MDNLIYSVILFFGLVVTLIYGCLELRKGQPIGVFWITTGLYLGLIGTGLATGVTSEFDGRQTSISVDREAARALVTSVVIGLIGGFIGQKLVERLLFTNRESTLRSNPLNQYLAILLACFSIPSTILGAGSSYEEFISGSAIGWGVTFLMISSSGACALAVYTNYGRLSVACLILCLFAGVSLAYGTGVRSLLMAPLIAVTVPYLVGTRAFRKRVLISIGSLGLIGIAVLWVWISDQRENYGPTGVEQHLLQVFLTMWVSQRDAAGYLGDEPFMRAILGIFNYPLNSVLRVNFVMEDAGTNFARLVAGEWVGAFHHYPATWILDVYFTSRFGVFFGSLVLVGLIAACCGLITRAKASAPFFYPLLVIWLILIARGAVWGASTTISASLIFLLVGLMVTSLINIKISNRGG